MRWAFGLLLLLLCGMASSLDLPIAPTKPGVKQPEGAAAPKRPNPIVSGFKRFAYPPIKLFREAPPITRSWVAASVFLSLLTSCKIVDLRAICFTERDVWARGEWWRLLTNFFYMGDQLLSIFYWMQIYHFWECLKMLELVKYHWEPSGFIKMIVCNSVMLLLLKQFRRETMFLGSPLVMTFMYMYSREYETQVTNFLGFFQIKIGWLPFAQMLQDGLQTGDIVPNLLGILAGHIYYYATEVVPMINMPKELPSLKEFFDPPTSAAPKAADADGDGDEDGVEAVADTEGRGSRVRGEAAASGEDGGEDEAADEGEGEAPEEAEQDSQDARA